VPSYLAIEIQKPLEWSNKIRIELDPYWADLRAATQMDMEIKIFLSVANRERFSYY